MIKRVFKQTEIYLFFIIIIFSTIATFLNPYFLTPENFFDITKTAAPMGILAIGFFMVLLSGGIDVSFTAIAISGMYIATKVLIAYEINNIFIAFFISCSVGIILGAINGVFIGIFKLPTLIVTLGTLNIFHGALLTFVGTKFIPVDKIPKCYIEFGKKTIFKIATKNGNTFGLSVFVLVFIGIAILSWLILKYTMLGRGIYAIGGDKNSATRAGFNILAIQFFIYCYSGFLAGIMGIMFASLIRLAAPTFIVGAELTVIAAVVLGGARITGGSGTIIGTVLGVIMISILNQSLVLIGLSSLWNEFFIGLIIVISVVITIYQNKRINRKKSIL